MTRITGASCFRIANAAGDRWPQLIITLAETFGQADPDASNVDKRGILAAIKSVLRGYNLPNIHTTELCARLGKVEGLRSAEKFRNKTDK